MAADDSMAKREPVVEQMPTLEWAVEWRPWLWRPAVEKSLSVVDDWSGLRVCELGSRSGRLATYLAHRGAHVTGFDLPGVDLEAARALAMSHGVAERVELRNYSGDTATIGETFDIVVTKSVLVAMPPEHAVCSIRRLVREGGWYLGTENRQLPSLFNRARRYRQLGFGDTHREALRGQFAEVRIRNTYGLVVSITAKA